jgi:hypothetical protein
MSTEVPTAHVCTVIAGGRFKPSDVYRNIRESSVIVSRILKLYSRFSPHH